MTFLTLIAKLPPPLPLISIYSWSYQLHPKALNCSINQKGDGMVNFVHSDTCVIPS